MRPRLPVTLPPFPDELLSSWLTRHAAFYAVSPEDMLRHCSPEAPSLRALDLNLNRGQAAQLSEILSIDPDAILRMAFGNIRKPIQCFISKSPMQHCSNCYLEDSEPAPIRRGQLLGWRITCSLCGGMLRSIGQNDPDNSFTQYFDIALRGEKLLNDDAEHNIYSWTSPLELARLLLMRRIPHPLPRGGDLWRFRVLGAVIPDLDNVMGQETSFTPCPKRPILSLRFRTALLAGVAIVERSGPEMLRMLQGHTFGHNRNNFKKESDRLIAQTFEWDSPKQMQLI